MSPRRSYLAFGDIEGKLDMLRIECSRCDRVVRYGAAKLIETYGRDGNMAIGGHAGLPRCSAQRLEDRGDKRWS